MLRAIRMFFIILFISSINSSVATTLFSGPDYLYKIAVASCDDNGCNRGIIVNCEVRWLQNPCRPANISKSIPAGLSNELSDYLKTKQLQNGIYAFKLNWGYNEEVVGFPTVKIGDFDFHVTDSYLYSKDQSALDSFENKYTSYPYTQSVEIDNYLLFILTYLFFTSILILFLITTPVIVHLKYKLSRLTIDEKMVFLEKYRLVSSPINLIIIFFAVFVPIIAIKQVFALGIITFNDVINHSVPLVIWAVFIISLIVYLKFVHFNYLQIRNNGISKSLSWLISINGTAALILIGYYLTSDIFMFCWYHQYAKEENMLVVVREVVYLGLAYIAYGICLQIMNNMLNSFLPKQAQEVAHKKLSLYGLKELLLYVGLVCVIVTTVMLNRFMDIAIIALCLISGLMYVYEIMPLRKIAGYKYWLISLLSSILFIIALLAMYTSFQRIGPVNLFNDEMVKLDETYRKFLEQENKKMGLFL